MTFTGRLRLSLVFAALLPTVLITVIVMVALSQQVKRIEGRDAEAACVRFTELLDNTSSRLEKNLQYIIDSREFQVMEWGLDDGSQPDPKYKLPLLSLDFVEYIDSEGIIIISASRPALVGQSFGADSTAIPMVSRGFVYENDLHGSHPSIAIILPTENGFIRGGIFLDGVFHDLASAVTRSNLAFVDMRDEGGSSNSPADRIGMPFRSDDDLYAVLAYDDSGQFYPVAHFSPYEQQSLFADFLTAVLVVTVFSLVLVIPAGLYFSARTRREFKTLTGGAIRVASGDFSRPVDTSGEGEFGELADSFNLMMRQLTDYRDKLIVSEKIAAWQMIGRKIAHEVKNPLTPISIAIDDLRDSYRSMPDDYEKILDDSSRTIKGEVNRIKKLIDQFSTFAKMPAPEFSQVGVAEFIKDISILFKEELSQGGLAIVNDAGDRPVIIDPEQMRQVIINLIKNSLEADCKHCTLTLSTDGNQLSIEVEDDGPGIPAKIIEHGPTPYFSTKEQGSGLGLIICQRIIYDHNGTMRIDNKPDGGARVVLTLPENNAENITR